MQDTTITDAQACEVTVVGYEVTSYDTQYSGGWVQAFRRNILLPSSGYDLVHAVLNC